MKLRVIVFAATLALIASCGNNDTKKEENSKKQVEQTEAINLDPMQDKGVGPITSVKLDAIDETMVADGKALFKTKCSACHKVSKRFVGPAMAGITERRTPEWIMNMILNPEVMVTQNAAAKKLLAEYLSPMANQSLTEEEARLILEYFRTLNAK